MSKALSKVRLMEKYVDQEAEIYDRIARKYVPLGFLFGVQSDHFEVLPSPEGLAASHRGYARA